MSAVINETTDNPLEVFSKASDVTTRAWIRMRQEGLRRKVRILAGPYKDFEGLYTEILSLRFAEIFDTIWSHYDMSSRLINLMNDEYEFIEEFSGNDPNSRLFALELKEAGR